MKRRRLLIKYKMSAINEELSHSRNPKKIIRHGHKKNVSNRNEKIRKPFLRYSPETKSVITMDVNLYRVRY